MSTELRKGQKMQLHFYVKINKENETKCLSKNFEDYKNKEEIELLSELREGIMITGDEVHHDYSDYYTKLEKLYEDDFDTHTYLKPFFEEDFKFDEEEIKNIKKRKRNE
ncbi:unnamed protein product [Meloidogyne enterolobii]|uniref:Uncharacterized protein n=1 Tax=Meloidogyne enterolobii TaxID=390850 RepID=A0ACB1B4E8_MELEN